MGMSVKPRNPIINGLMNAYPVKFLRNDEYCLNGTNLLHGSACSLILASVIWTGKGPRICE